MTSLNPNTKEKDKLEHALRESPQKAIHLANKNDGKDDEDDTALIALVKERLANPQPIYLELHELSTHA